MDSKCVVDREIEGTLFGAQAEEEGQEFGAALQDAEMRGRGSRQFNGR